MSDHKDLFEMKLLDEIRLTGFPTEIVAASLMQSRKWGVIQNPSYWDDMGNVSREFDIRAYKRWVFDVGDIEFRIGVYLITECKKSEKPWVFFVTPEDNYQYRHGEYVKSQIAKQRIFTTREYADSLISDEQLSSFHHYFQSGKLARTYYEPFRGKEKADHSHVIHSAVLATIKATQFHLKNIPRDRWLRIYYPLIVFKGDMYEATVKSIEEVDLKQVSDLQLSFNFTLPATLSDKTIEQRQDRFIIDFVHLDYLPQFLENIEKEHEDLSELLKTTLLNSNNFT